MKWCSVMSAIFATRFETAVIFLNLTMPLSSFINLTL